MTPGTTLGPYRIEAALGRGGMGEVFRALDTRLNRKVAIKVSAEKFSGRFDREARAIAALNHANICTLYDVGPNYLVMELVEGETLYGRLRKGPLPMDLVVRYGTQIADALSAAHAKGITHRDLKPGNIMITRAGVKVLDFGLAKIGQDETVTASLAILGTPAYMAPEQRAGKPCDARTDIYSLGLVLHEMAAGSRPDPNLSAGLPRQFAHVVERCLAHDPGERWQSALDLRRELEWAAQQDLPAAPVRPAASRKSILAAAGIVVGIAIAVAIATLGNRGPAASPVARLALPLPAEAIVVDPPGGVGPPVISPDGTTVAVCLGTGPDRNLWTRRLDSGRFERLAGTQGANYPFWSPDGRNIGFFADDKLKRIPASGGDPQPLCSVTALTERGASWNASGAIVYGVNYSGLFLVSDRGGVPVKVGSLDPAIGENSLRHPAFFADGKHFLCFSRTRKLADRGLYLYSLNDAGEAQRKKLAVTDQELSVGHNPRTGRDYALFARAGKLWAQTIDIAQGVLTGEPSAIEENAGLFSVSQNGTLVFRRTDIEQIQYTWYDRGGREIGGAGTPADSWDVQLSPDGRYATFNNHRSLDGHFSVWLIDLARNVSQPFSLQTERSTGSVWSSDSSRVYFTSDRESGSRGFIKAVDGAGEEQPFTPLAGIQVLLDRSADGKYLLASRGGDKGKAGLVYTETAQENWKPLIGPKSVEDLGQFSPDGKWVAYQSLESGSWQIYVVDFPDARRKLRISVDGGEEPRWRRDGKELLYYSPQGAIMSASLPDGPGRPAAPPKPLFHIRFSNFIAGFHYAVSHDAQRILASKETGRELSRDLHVIINWPQLLK